MFNLTVPLRIYHHIQFCAFMGFLCVYTCMPLCIYVFLGLFFFCLFICFVFFPFFVVVDDDVLFHHISFYYYELDECFLKGDRKELDSNGVWGWGGMLRNWRMRNCYQNILYKKSVFNKKK